MGKTTLLHLIQIAAAIILVLSILLQGGGAGLSSPFGGGGESFRTRRGVEKILLYATVMAASVFILAVVTNLLI